MNTLRLVIDLVLDNDDYLNFPEGDASAFLRELEGCNLNVLDSNVLVHREDPRVYCFFGLAQQATIVEADIAK